MDERDDIVSAYAYFSRFKLLNKNNRSGTSLDQEPSNTRTTLVKIAEELATQTK